MTRNDREKLREAALVAQKASRHVHASDWELQTSNSFRRIGTRAGDGDVLCAITQRADGHPDLLAPHGVLDYIVAAQPHVVIALLDELDRCEEAFALLRKSLEVQDAELDRLEKCNRALTASPSEKMQAALDAFVGAKKP